MKFTAFLAIATTAAIAATVTAYTIDHANAIQFVSPQTSLC